MTAKSKQVFNEALSLPAAERISLVDTLISSLDLPDPAIDSLWHKEAESRVRAYRKGQIKTVALEHAIAKYKR
jgi:putative addiction module component (TIGR02574 family)